jgi:hypothetical protein
MEMPYDGTTFYFNRETYNDRIFTNMNEIPEGELIS